MAAKDIADLKTEVSTNFPNNTAKFISPTRQRSVFNDVIDSYVNTVDTTAQEINSDLNVIGSLTVNSQPVVYGITTYISQASTATSQLPGATDTPLLIAFGTGVVTAAVTTATGGTITFNETGTYFVEARFRVGRAGSAAWARLVITQSTNGAYVDSISASLLDDANSSAMVVHSGFHDMTATDTMTFHIIRDSAGDNDGGLYLFNPALVGVPNVPTAYLSIQKVEV